MRFVQVDVICMDEMMRHNSDDSKDILSSISFTIHNSQPLNSTKETIRAEDLFSESCRTYMSESVALQYLWLDQKAGKLNAHLTGRGLCA